ncbi:FUSC family protein, partial [Escherichia coli]|nr:FUSC family protein [Escherichia coli]
HADLVFALKTFAASMLALVIALAIDLPRPYWAMATVYITSQPLAGATSSKAFFRVMGTLIGAIVTVAMVPNLVNAPELLCLAIAL